MSFIRVSKSACYLKSAAGDSFGDFCGVVLHIGSLTIPLVLRNCVFNEACKWHDKEYQKLDWSNWRTNSKALDYELLRQFFEIAGSNKKLKIQAVIMFSLARLWGKLHWGLARLGIIW